MRRSRLLAGSRPVLAVLAVAALWWLRKLVDTLRMDRAPGGPWSMIAHGPTAPEACANG